MVWCLKGFWVTFSPHFFNTCGTHVKFNQLPQCYLLVHCVEIHLSLFRHMWCFPITYAGTAGDTIRLYPVLFAHNTIKAFIPSKNWRSWAMDLIIHKAKLLLQLWGGSFELSVERNPGLFWFCFGFTLLCDWSSKLPSHFPPIRFKTNTNRVLIPCFRKFACSNFEFHWLLVIISFVLIGCCDHFGFSFNVTQSKYALNRHFLVKDSPIR